MIQAYKSHTPKIAKTAYVHPSAVIIGDVTIGEYTNIWPGAVLRGDLQPIVVGDYTNIQDNVTVHVMSNAPIILAVMLLSVIMLLSIVVKSAIIL